MALNLNLPAADTPIVQDLNARDVSALYAQVTSSAANNTLLYDYFEKRATLEEIVHFIRWDGEEPHYYLYLEQWLDRIPNFVRRYLKEHIDIEVNEQHSRHFQEMLAHLNTKILTKSTFDPDQISALNYTFSGDALRSEDYGFFIGGFFTTEIMHSKRAGQLMRGLLRNGIELANLKYLEIHHEADEDHGLEVGEMMIKPILRADPTMLTSIQFGVSDRLARSKAYLDWYERTQLRHD